jgi:hypothetical protein
MAPQMASEVQAAARRAREDAYGNNWSGEEGPLACAGQVADWFRANRCREQLSTSATWILGQCGVGAVGNELDLSLFRA